MASLLRSLPALLLVSNAMAISFVGTPQRTDVIKNKVKPMGSGDAGNVPDGKMLSFRADPNDKSKGFIINTCPNFFMTSTSSALEDVTAPRDLSGVNNATALPGDQGGDQGGYIVIEPTIPIPSAEVTGMRGNGSVYDQLSVWIFGAFRLCETSKPGADCDEMVGFEHNEDYFGKSDCTYKSIGVRYSTDAGKSWTRSVPIITSGQETATCNESSKFTGSGDFAPTWNHVKKEWVIFAPETSLAMRISSDPMASPGSWQRINPVKGLVGPGWIGDPSNPDWSHDDLASIPGANPSIIFDQKNDIFHMVWSIWGDGIAYSKSSDLYRWDKPSVLFHDDTLASGSKYPTLIGDEGDNLATDGTATMYFGADSTDPDFRALWTVKVDFGTSGAPGNKSDTPNYALGNSTATNTSSLTNGTTASINSTSTGVVAAEPSASQVKAHSWKKFKGKRPAKKASGKKSSKN